MNDRSWEQARKLGKQEEADSQASPSRAGEEKEEEGNVVLQVRVRSCLHFIPAGRSRYFITVLLILSFSLSLGHIFLPLDQCVVIHAVAISPKQLASMEAVDGSKETYGGVRLLTGYATHWT